MGESLSKRVLKAATDLDYRPNALARGLLRKRTHTLGLLITDIANSFFGEILRGIEEVCRKQGYSIFICNTDRDPATVAEYVGVLREKQVDGVLIVGGGVSGPQPFDVLPAYRVPVVVLGRFDAPLPAARINYLKGGWKAAKHLIELGHRRIGVILGPRKSTTSHDIMRGYRQAFAEHGVTVANDAMLHGDAQAASALSCAERLLRTASRPTGLLAVNDHIAMGSIRAARNLGLRVPQDISIVGFDGIELGSFMNPALTTLRLPIRQMGVTVAEMILRLIAGEEISREVWFEPELIVRESTAPPPVTGEAPE